MKVVGLMSGTSMDGIDAALLEIEGTSPADFAWRLIGLEACPYPEARRRQLKDAIDQGSAESLCRLHADLGEWLADAVFAVCSANRVAPAELRVIGSHGHTVWHTPPADQRGATLQLGDAATIAERTGVDVVADFRTADVAAGGQGAPLVPWPDRLLFTLPDRSRALQNLGGMGNVTWLPPRGSGETLLAFDTGPGNVLLDAAAEAATDGRLAFDESGAMAARGTVDFELLARLMDDPFFSQAPPRSTGRERFGPALVRALAAERGLERGAPWRWLDLLATLTAFTARSVGDAYRQWVIPRGVDEVVLTGGGARNPTLARAIAQELEPLPVRGPEALGLDPSAREPAAFAVLAWAHVMRVSANAPEATGAVGPRVLGSLTPGKR